MLHRRLGETKAKAEQGGAAARIPDYEPVIRQRRCHNVAEPTQDIDMLRVRVDALDAELAAVPDQPLAPVVPRLHRHVEMPQKWLPVPPSAEMCLATPNHGPQNKLKMPLGELHATAGEYPC